MPSTSFRYILVLLFGLAVLGPTSARASEKLAQVASPLIQEAVRSSLPTFSRRVGLGAHARVHPTRQAARQPAQTAAGTCQKGEIPWRLGSLQGTD